MRKLSIILAAPLLLLSCGKNAESDNCNTPCPLVHTSFVVQVLDAQNNKVMLQKAALANVQTGDTTIVWFSERDSSYVVFSDSDVTMRNKTYNYIFIGTLNNVQVFNEPYTFSADCCHINKVSGKETITIQ